MLPQSTIQRIADEADEYARTYSGTKLIKRPYIAGAEKEAERAQPIIKIIEEAIADKNLTYLGRVRAEYVEKIREELTKYNNPK